MKLEVLSTRDHSSHTNVDYAVGDGKVVPETRNSVGLGTGIVP